MPAEPQTLKEVLSWCQQQPSVCCGVGAVHFWLRSMLAPADRAKWEAERAEALKKEEEQRKVEAEAANQKV